MEREIKFRAWDGKIMTTFSLDIDGEGYLTTAPVPQKHFDSTKEGFKELMQYTGLKDKNGVDIFEGDILRRKRVNMVVFFSDVKSGFQVKYRNIWKTLDYKPDRCFKTLSHAAEGEVIGNIYENPELLP